MVALSVSMSPSLVERDLLTVVAVVVAAAVEEDSMHPERKMLSYMLVT